MIYIIVKDGGKVTIMESKLAFGIVSLELVMIVSSLWKGISTTSIPSQYHLSNYSLFEMISPFEVCVR